MTEKQHKSKQSHRIGREIIADMRGCDPRVIDDEQLLKRLVQEAIRTTKHHLLDISVRKFHPIGVTVLGLLAESHISLHTYPELGYVAIDIFTCGANRPEPILEYLREKLGAKQMYSEYIRRGTMKQWKNIYDANGYKRQVEIIKNVHTRITPYQKLEVVKAKALGLCLFANNILQVASSDAHIYDEQMLKHLDDAKSVLIVGGGDCSILKRLVANKDIKEIYMFEQDQQVVEVAKKFLGASKALRDPRLKMFYGDAIQTIPFLRDKKIDFAILDIISYPDSKAKKFYDTLFDELSEIKVPRFATQAGHILDVKEKRIILSAAKKAYKKIEMEQQFVFSNGMVNFLYGSGIK